MGERRDFLRVCAGGTVAIGLLGACNDDGQPQPGGVHSAGNVADIAVGELKGVGSAAIVLGRDVDGLWAMTTICTHQQCNMRESGTVSNSGLSCECHGSRFDANGAVTSSPATSPLRHFQVEVDVDGEITIDADVVVDAEERTPVP